MCSSIHEECLIWNHFVLSENLGLPLAWAQTLSIYRYHCCLSVLVCAGIVCGVTGHANNVMQVLTLYASKLTTGRRSAPLPQLSCQGVPTLSTR